MIYLRYILYFILSLLVTWLCWLTNPIACLFPSRQPNGRDKLLGMFELWSTFDNHVDEFFYGGYNGHYPTVDEQSGYNNSRWIRYKYRLKWLSRNTGYGWSYLLFSIPRSKGFQLKGQSKPFLGYYNDYNIGWRSHEGMPKLDIATRLVGLRK